MWYNVDRIQRIKIDSRNPLQVGIEFSEINLPITLTGLDAELFVEGMKHFGIDLLIPFAASGRNFFIPPPTPVGE
jgi:hypothetical protein